jgi:predicted phosphodiesterase
VYTYVHVFMYIEKNKQIHVDMYMHTHRKYFIICNIIFLLNPGINASIIGEVRKNFTDFPPLSADRKRP